MGAVLTIGTAVLLLALLARQGVRARRTARDGYIARYPFPSALGRAVQRRYPDLNEQQTALVLRGLRDYFHICNRAGRRMVAMPSRAVDVAWHELILHTQLYARFCREGLGRFLHHTPAEAMRAPTLAQAGIRRAWKHACQREGIDPGKPQRLPLLFALDDLLGIPDGFRYRLDCRRDGSGYCAGHIGCGSGGCVSDGGGGGDASGCGGGGCGGD